MFSHLGHAPPVEHVHAAHAGPHGEELGPLLGQGQALDLGGRGGGRGQEAKGELKHPNRRYEEYKMSCILLCIG
jgi:hypothetical protein